jgi:2-oxoglutarate dehydrogenase E2 component (dihydrolipoamide succinyltransferase)
MAKYQLLLPKMGESVAEATIIKWLKQPGDYIEADESVMDIATDKVDSEVPSPVSGTLVQQLYEIDDVVQVGAVIAIIETKEAGESPASNTTKPSIPEITEHVKQQEAAPTNFYAKEEESVAEITEPIPGTEQLPDSAQAFPTAVNNQITNVSDNVRFYSPLVRSIASQEGIGNNELDSIPGTGAEGRLTKDDLLQYIQKKVGGAFASQPPAMLEHVKAKDETSAPQSAPVVNSTKPQPVREQKIATPAENKLQTAAQPKSDNKQTSSAQPKIASVSGEVEIIEMDRMRKLIAEHMVYSKHTSPHVTSFVEADVTSMVKWREKIKDKFEAREGEKITFTPIFIEAVVKAIKDYPMINVSVNGTQIIKKKDINISMATALPSGNLIVPVIKKADKLNLVGITKAVNDLANRARTSKLLPDDVKEGTFTITNVGSFGNVMGTPIINQPQVAILAVGAIKKKPAVLETKMGDVIAIRHMMFLSLSYDHRVVDGALGGMFVRKVADYLENWDINREI